MEAYSPQDAAAAQPVNGLVPNEVIQAVNDLLAERYSGGRSTVTIYLKEVVTQTRKLLTAAGKEAPIQGTMADRGWLDFEPIFQKKGWSVHYDAPAYDESYEPFFEFRAK